MRCFKIPRAHKVSSFDKSLFFSSQKARRCISSRSSENPRAIAGGHNSSRLQATRTASDSSAPAADKVLQVSITLATRTELKCLQIVMRCKLIHKNLRFISLTSSDPAVHALQFLDVINMKDPTQKAYFYRSTLKDALPFIPRVSDDGEHK